MHVYTAHLKGLTWLDLSFNKIKKISGLEELTQLTDLSLSNNEISALDGVAHLPKLEVLTLANNTVSTLAEVAKLRYMPSLRVLALAGNPVERKGAGSLDYRGAVLARLQRLQYLDFERVTDEERQAAVESNRQDLEKLRRTDDEHASRTKAEHAAAERAEKLTTAGLDKVASIWDAMLSDPDEETAVVSRSLEALLKIPDMAEWWEGHAARVQERVSATVEEGLLQQESIQEETEGIDYALAHVRLEAEEQGKRVVDGFGEARKRLERLLEDESAGLTQEDATARIRQVQRLNAQMRTELSEAEIELHETARSMLSTYDTAFDTVSSERKKLVADLFKTIGELENQFKDECKSHLAALSESLSSDGSGAGVLRTNGGQVIRQAELDPDTLSLIQDREQGMSIVLRFKEARMTLMFTQENVWGTQETEREVRYVKQREELELDRHRKRFDEIDALCTANDKELGDFLAMGLDQDDM